VLGEDGEVGLVGEDGEDGLEVISVPEEGDCVFEYIDEEPAKLSGLGLVGL